MDNSGFVLALLEKKLGDGKAHKHGDYAFFCPICNHHKRKLIVNIVTGQYNCFTCNPHTKGKYPISLLKKIGASKEEISEMKSYFKDSTDSVAQTNEVLVTMPEEAMKFSDPGDPMIKRLFLTYLQSRNISKEDILKYDIRFCFSGKYRKRIIVPSYNSNGRLAYFIARSIEQDAYLKYTAPECSMANLIGFENMINWDVPIILCEGVFDAIAFKRNAIPLFGKKIQNALKLKLAESRVKTVYLALDRDAYSECISYAEELINLGKEVYLLDMEDKDPSVIGFEKLTKMLHNAKPITIQNLFVRKLMKI